MTQKQELHYYKRLLGLTKHCLKIRNDYQKNLTINESELLNILESINTPLIKSFMEVSK